MKYDYLGFDIKDIQREILSILIEFDKICKANNIDYQLFAGTLLGAIRHNGFIPWDDDIDVCLTRKDYDRFIDLCKSELNDDFFIQTYNTDEKYVLQFAKLRKNNTLFLEGAYSELEIHHGFYIDIFPLDNIMPNSIMGSIQKQLLHLFRRLNRARIRKLCIDTNKIHVKVFRLLLHYFVRIIPRKWTNKIYTKIATMFNSKDTKYMSHLLNGIEKGRYTKFKIERNTFHETLDIDFEGYKFPVPVNYDILLRRVYGDYMELPPKEERKPHHGILEVKLSGG